LNVSKQSMPVAAEARAAPPSAMAASTTSAAAPMATHAGSRRCPRAARCGLDAFINLDNGASGGVLSPPALLQRSAVTGTLTSHGRKLKSLACALPASTPLTAFSRPAPGA
jgi:hypothetical protein